jgi:hypothetical protein
MRIRPILLTLGLLPVLAGSALGDASTPAFTFPASDDTVRSNLWLARALMTEVMESAVAVLPPPPARIVLCPQGKGEGLQMMSAVAADILERHGYELYLREEVKEPSAEAAADSLLPPPPPRVDYELRYRIEDIRLVYPEIGRRFGIWREWVARDLVLSAYITVLDPHTGRLLLSDRLERSFRDRVPNASLAAVRSDLYPFTDAALEESSWRRRLEQLVVLGTLTGLVAIYFANTGN